MFSASVQRIIGECSRFEENVDLLERVDRIRHAMWSLQQLLESILVFGAGIPSTVISDHSTRPSKRYKYSILPVCG